MLSWQPCCFKISLQQGVQLLAVFNIAFETLLLATMTIYCVAFNSNVPDPGWGHNIPQILGGNPLQKIVRQHAEKLGVLTVWIIFIVIITFCITANYYLLKGATEKSTRKIKIYLILFSIFCMFGFISSLARGLSWTLIVLIILSYLPAAYEFWVIFSFLRQLRSVDQIA